MVAVERHLFRGFWLSHFDGLIWVAGSTWLGLSAWVLCPLSGSQMIVINVMDEPGRGVLGVVLLVCFWVLKAKPFTHISCLSIYNMHFRKWRVCSKWGLFRIWTLDLYNSRKPFAYQFSWLYLFRHFCELCATRDKIALKHLRQIY